MSEQPTTSAASDEEKFQALQCIIKRLEKARECPPAFSRQRIHSEALRDAMQDAFLEALKWGAFAGPRWAALYIGYGNPNEPNFSNLLRYAKEEGFVDTFWNSAKGTYKDVIDEAAGQLIELLRQEAAAGAENGGGGKADPQKAPAEDAQDGAASHGDAEAPDRGTHEEIVELKPNLYGIGINLKALWRWMR
jgi:hypothetical protein